MLLDGAMGTMIQRYALGEEDYRGEEFSSHDVLLAGNNDILALSRPDLLSAIHRAYLEAGSDIITTCTFNAQVISQAEYRTEHLVRRINLAAATIARAEADRMTSLTPNRPRFVAGSVGPTGKTASLSPDVDDPAMRAVDFDMLQRAYAEQIEALVEGGVDLLLVETAFDTLNVKAALAAAESVFANVGRHLPIMLSVTIADAAGRMLSGQTLEALLASVAHVDLFSVGLNCSFGAEQMIPFLKQLSDVTYYVSAYPNAGIPDEDGRYDQTPERMAASVERFVKERLVNIVGGCCGSTPDHIRAIAGVVQTQNLRKPSTKNAAWLAGLDAFSASDTFVNVGERCNVAGSRKFLRLISEKSYDEALSIARAQVRDGAMVLDINMDDAMLDARAEMTHFLNLMASDPEVARLPWMVDSSRFEVIEAALKTIQGKAIVNSLSLKEGEAVFIERARRVRALGAAVVVMAFDEQGQATTYERRIEICHRAYRILTEQVGFAPRDIIFDPNVLTIATGMREHDSYALDFIRATEWIKLNLAGARVSGGVSNLSFAFRGNNYLREAMHAVFLYHAIRAGMDMAIVNPSTKVMYEDIPATLREALEDVVLCRREDATERLLSLAEQFKTVEQRAAEVVDRRIMPLADRLIAALQRGDEEFLHDDLQEALQVMPSPSAIIEGPLMQGMMHVGKLFGEGKMFLPQVVKTARTMKRAVEILRPHIEAQSVGAAHKAGRYLLATVKGDVHDIGKNIASVVLSCNNFEVIDLGVMVPAEQIVRAAIEHKVDFIGLSGLITPSLEEMCRVARELREAGVSVPLMIGGATTSPLHTALKIAPLYDGAVFHVKDAAQNPILAMQLLGEERESVIRALKDEQQRLREEHGAPKPSASESERLKIDWSQEQLPAPSYTGVKEFAITAQQVREYINWRHFYNLWRVEEGSAEADKIRAEAEALLDSMSHGLLARVGFFAARGTESAIVLSHNVGCACCHPKHETVLATPRQRTPNADGVTLALCDFVAPEGDWVGAFALTVAPSFAQELSLRKEQGKEYEALLLQSVGDRLVEAASEWLHERVRRELWGYAPQEQLSVKEMFQARYRGIRPAVGYPSLPDQRLIFPLAELLDVEKIGISLTENGAMYPQSSVCGLYLASPHARYFIIE